MSSYELNNKEGANYLLRHGAGPGVLHDDNLARSEFHAERILAGVPDIQLYDAFGYFYFTKLQRLELSGNPRTALAQAIGDSHLVIEQLAGSSAGPLAFVDKRFMIRNNIRQQLNAWIAEEQAHKKIREALYNEENYLNQLAIDAGARTQGVINFAKDIKDSVWGLACWLYDVNELANPIYIQYREFQAYKKARSKLGEEASFSSVMREQNKQAKVLHDQKLVEVLGFDPSQVTRDQLEQALDVAAIICTDTQLWGIFSDFAIDYLKAQHHTELYEVGVAGILELILLAALAYITLGVGVVAAVGAQMRHLPKLKKIGKLLVEFADASKAFNRQVKERAAKIDGDNSAPKFTELDTVEGGAKKTDPHGANTGSISKPNNTANAAVPAEVPMSQEKFDEIINLEQENRPNDVGEYLPEEYIATHLGKFNDEGGAFIVVEDWIEGSEYPAFQKDGKFVGLSSEMDTVIDKYKSQGNDWTVLRDELNLGENVDLSDTRISYVKIQPEDDRFSYDMPTGNEGGAYEGEWVPGGFTKSGTREASLSGGDIIEHNNNLDNLADIPGLEVEMLQ